MCGLRGAWEQLEGRQTRGGGACHCLEGAAELHEEWRLLGQREHPALSHGAVNVVVLHELVLLEDLNGELLLGTFTLGEHHLPEAALPEQQHEREVARLRNVEPPAADRHACAYTRTSAQLHYSVRTVCDTVLDCSYAEIYAILGNSLEHCTSKV